MKLSQLKIDPEFQSKIPPLQFEEEQQLEQNIIAEGRLLNPIITWNGYILDGQNTVEARRTCNGGMELPIRCKVFYGLTKEDEATLFAIQTGNATCLTAGERLRANLVAENPDALYFVGITSNAGVEFAYDGIRAPWKIYCIETAYELYKQYGCERYVEMLHIINEAWKGNVDSYLAGVIRGVARFSEMKIATKNGTRLFITFSRRCFANEHPTNRTLPTGGVMVPPISESPA